MKAFWTRRLGFSCVYWIRLLDNYYPVFLWLTRQSNSTACEIMTGVHIQSAISDFKGVAVGNMYVWLELEILKYNQQPSLGRTGGKTRLWAWSIEEGSVVIISRIHIFDVSLPLAPGYTRSHLCLHTRDTVGKSRPQAAHQLLHPVSRLIPLPRLAACE